MKIKEILTKIQQVYKPDYSNEYVQTYSAYDNQGLNVGDNNLDTDSILVCLDITSSVIDEAIASCCKLIVSHHPIIYLPINSVNNNTYIGGKIVKLIQNNICAYSVHLTLDAIPRGIGCIIANIAGVGKDYYLQPLQCGGGLGLVRELIDNVCFNDLVIEYDKHSRYDKVRSYGRNKRIGKICCIGGCSGLNEKLVDDLIDNKVDCFVGAEFCNHVILYALERGLNIIDIGHYNGEAMVLTHFAKDIGEILQSGVRVDVAKNILLI